MRQSVLLISLVATLMLVGTVSAATENFQNGGGMYYHATGNTVITIGDPVVPEAEPYVDTHAAGGVSSFSPIIGTTAQASNAFSWTPVIPDSGNNYAFKVFALDQNSAIINSIAGTTWYEYGAGGDNRMRLQVLREDGILNAYANGILVAGGAVCAAQPYYWYLYESNRPFVDDIIVGGTDTAVVGAPPESWAVIKDISDPTLSGLYDANMLNVANTQMHTSFSIQGDPTGATISIDGDHQITAISSITNPINISSSSLGPFTTTASRAGYVTFNLTQFMAVKSYGRHTIELTTGSETVETDFWYKGVASQETNITFDRDIYAPADSVEITSTIGTTYWQPGLYSYQACLLDATTGLVKGPNWTITDQVSTHSTSVTTDLFPASGEYLTLLYAIDSGGNEILLDTDSCQVYTNKIVFSGTVYDAQQGTVISGATVNLAHPGSTVTQTTGSDGRFEFVNLDKDVLTQLSAAKTGYITAWSNTTPNEYKRYEVQIALSPTSPEHSGEAVFGVVRSYPYGSFVESPTVRILHDGALVNTTTATSKGFFIFDGLTASKTYTIEVEKEGFTDYSNAVVTGSGGSSLTEINPWLIPYYSLTVHLVDAVSMSPITALMAVSVAGQSQQTTNGTVTFDEIQMGAASIATVGSGYTPNETALTMVENTEITLYITPLPVVPTTNIPLTPTPTPALVSMTGKVYDSMSGQPITSTVVNVSAVQGAVTRSDSTDSSGSYSIPNIHNGALITVNATAPGYTHTAFSFTPAGAATYVVDLYMYRTDESTNPTITPSAGRAGAGGTVLGGPYHELIESPTVAASNGSWTGTATMTADHVWYFTDLEPGQAYNFTAAASGFITQSVQATMGTENSFTVVPIILDALYDVTITVKDSASYALILQPVQLTLSNGLTGNTSTGSYTFTNLEYATYVVSAASEGYTQGGISFLAYGDHTEYLYLSKTPSGPSSSIEYAIPPKHVDLIARNIFGAPLSGVNVTVQGQSTTLPDPSILDAIFGWVDDYSEVNMANVTMTGVTGSDGGVSFMMTDAVRYLVTFTDPTRGISETVELMPHDTQYMFILGSMSATPSAGMPNMTLWVDGEEGASPALRGYYSDPAGTTSALYFIVESINGTTRTEVGNQSLGAVQTASPSYTVNHTTGAMYSWGFRATTPDRGVLQQWNGITLHSRLVTLPIEESAYFWISMILVFVFAGLFSGNNIKYGFVAFPMFCGVLWYIGWLDVAGITLGIVMVLGVLMYLAKVQVA